MNTIYKKSKISTQYFYPFLSLSYTQLLQSQVYSVLGHNWKPSIFMQPEIFLYKEKSLIVFFFAFRQDKNLLQEQ